MHITIEGKQIDLGDALRQRVSERLTEAVGKYFGDGIEGSATFSREAHEIHVDCAVHIGQDIFLKSQGRHNDAHSAFENAADRIEKQLRRYKRRLRDHHAKQKQMGLAVTAAQAYVLAPDETEDDTETVTGDNPAIIAETRASVPTCTVSDAVMRLDLGQLPVLMFRNIGNDRLNVVYRRSDGHIGWIDPNEG